MNIVLRSTSWVRWLNALLLQWAFIRLVRIRDGVTGELLGWRVLRWVIPMTGFVGPLRYLRWRTGHGRAFDRDMRLILALFWLGATFALYLQLSSTVLR